jgi:acyl-coenzyme A synthetase/AMP-(fatty) acid ligase
MSEAAIVGYRNDIKGQGIFAYVTLVGRITVDGAAQRNRGLGAQEDWAEARRTSSNSF